MAVDPAIAHLVRRAGFGYSPAEGEMLDQMSVPALVDALVDYESVPRYRRRQHRRAGIPRDHHPRRLSAE
jgi:hypothetical protein